VIEKALCCRRHEITLSHPGIQDVVLHYSNLEDITDDKMTRESTVGSTSAKIKRLAPSRHLVGRIVFGHNLHRLFLDRH